MGSRAFSVRCLPRPRKGRPCFAPSATIGFFVTPIDNLCSRRLTAIGSLARGEIRGNTRRNTPRSSCAASCQGPVARLCSFDQSGSRPGALYRSWTRQHQLEADFGGSSRRRIKALLRRTGFLRSAGVREPQDELRLPQEPNTVEPRAGAGRAQPCVFVPINQGGS